MKTALTILKEARELIPTPEKWIQSSYAGIRQTDGSVLLCMTWLHEKANCFCSIGSMRKVIGYIPQITNPEQIEEYRKAMQVLEACMNYDIAEYNDFHDHPDILKKFDEAIAILETVE